MRPLLIRGSRLHRPKAPSRCLNPGSLLRLSSSARPVNETEPGLVAWVKQHGGKVDGASLANLAGRDGGSGWGLKALKDVEAGHRFVVLPPACHLTYGTNDDPRLLALIDKVPSELWGAKLALQLIAHRVLGRDSSFSAYISELPMGVPGIPMFFNKRGIDAIDYPPVAQQVTKRCKWLVEFSKLLAQLPGTPHDPFGGAAVDINALGWAMACVSSRAFRTRGPTHPAAMLPLIDMANHSFSPNTEVLPVEGGALGLFAKRKVSAGEPLLLSYGKLSNDYLFMDYGFIIPDNPYDTVQLRFDVGLLQAGAVVANVSDAMGGPLELAPAAWQQGLLAELGLWGAAANTELHVGGPDLVDRRLLAAARLLAARQEAEVAGRGGAERLMAVDKPLSRENEAAALRIVAGVLAVALSNFRTALDADLKLLSAGVGGAAAGAPSAGAAASDAEPLASDDEVLAVRFRVEKKRILSRALQRVAELTRAAAANSELRQSSGVAAAKKGAKPAPSTPKGFGKK